MCCKLNIGVIKLATVVAIVCILGLTSFGVWGFFDGLKQNKRREQRLERFMTAIEEIAKSK